MEKIVIFVIIMIVSSYFSKKKRKRATFIKKENDTMFFDDKGNKISESSHRSTSKPTVNSTNQPQNMSEALNELKNIFTNPAQQKPTHKPMHKPAPVYETNYPEVSTEANNASYSEKDYQQVQSNYETYMQKDKTDSIKKEISEVSPLIKEKENSYTIKANNITHRKDILSNLFNSRNNLKKAVIITEVFNKKY
jgi:FtsZ-interacting cell division protein ZipA